MQQELGPRLLTRNATLGEHGSGDLVARTTTILLRRNYVGRAFPSDHAPTGLLRNLPTVSSIAR